MPARSTQRVAARRRRRRRAASPASRRARASSRSSSVSIGGSASAPPGPARVRRCSASAAGRRVVEDQGRRQAQPGRRAEPVAQLDRGQRVEAQVAERPARAIASAPVVAEHRAAVCARTRSSQRPRPARPRTGRRAAPARRRLVRCRPRGVGRRRRTPGQSPSSGLRPSAGERRGEPPPVDVATRPARLAVGHAGPARRRQRRVHRHAGRAGRSCSWRPRRRPCRPPAHGPRRPTSPASPRPRRRCASASR